MRKRSLNTATKHEILESGRGSIYYLADPAKLGTTAVKESAMLEAVLSIAKKQGLIITEEMILYELQNKKTKLTK